jgi:hypothetical protein
LTGCREVYLLFRPWLGARRGGPEVAAEVEAAMARLDAEYAAIPGDAIPAPPHGWSGIEPRPEDLATSFGRLFAAVRREVDPRSPRSLVASLTRVAERLDLPPPLR